MRDALRLNMPRWSRISVERGVQPSRHGDERVAGAKQREADAMKDHSHVTIWDPEEAPLSLEAMKMRIASCISYRGWQWTMTMLADRNQRLHGLRVVEIGAGTGTFSLTLGLLGASVTLIDYNEKALERAKQIYSMFGCPAQFVFADCLEAAPAHLAGTFDLAVSGGLAEHFVGAMRSACVAYHRALLREEGLVFIGVPNRRSPFYRWIRWFRGMTKTWDIDIEIPYSDLELLVLAKEVGFQNYFVLGNAPLMRDLKEYSRGFVSALVDLLPTSVQTRARQWKAGRRNGAVKAQPSDVNIPAQCRAMCEATQQQEHNERRHVLADKFSAGLVLFAVK
jgi:SAM-dependent methyltransferase